LQLKADLNKASFIEISATYVPRERILADYHIRSKMVCLETQYKTSY